jgi:hypothetical protein
LYIYHFWGIIPYTGEISVSYREISVSRGTGPCGQTRKQWPVYIYVSRMIYQCLLMTETNEYMRDELIKKESINEMLTLQIVQYY